MRILPLLAALLAAPAAADEHIEELVVTGEFRAADLDSLPASIAVLDGAAVARRDAKHLEEALAMAANLNVSSGANRARFIQIRGIGERGQFREPLNPSVGLIVDGIDLSSVGTAATLFDLEQVEVFRGPQGTLYGAYALAGLVNITTAAPTETTEVRFEAGAANYGGWHLGGVVSGALNERLLGRLAVQQHDSDGFMRNRFLGRDDTNRRDEFTLRGKLRWLLGDGLQLDTTLLHVDMDNGYDAFSLPPIRISFRRGRRRNSSTNTNAKA